MAKNIARKKIKIVTKEQIKQFFNEAQDKNYPMLKIDLIIGIFGPCHREELCQTG